MRLGVCRELGRDRLYCNALRISDIGFKSVVGFLGERAFGARFDELRVCIKGTEAIGYIASGGAPDVPVVLFDEYPKEYKTLLEHPEINVSSDLRLVFEDGRVRDTVVSTVKQTFQSRSQQDTLRQLGIDPNSEYFPDSRRRAPFIAAFYPPHILTINKCQR